MHASYRRWAGKIVAVLLMGVIAQDPRHVASGYAEMLGVSRSVPERKARSATHLHPVQTDSAALIQMGEAASVARMAAPAQARVAMGATRRVSGLCCSRSRAALGAQTGRLLRRRYVYDNSLLRRRTVQSGDWPVLLASLLHR